MEINNLIKEIWCNECERWVNEIDLISYPKDMINHHWRRCPNCKHVLIRYIPASIT